jgi:thioredoxin reductase (NADPH)
MRNIKTEILIVGAGPAGLTAGLYAARAGKKTVIMEGRAASRLSVDYQIENYPGFPSIGSVELLDRFRAQATQFGAEILSGDALAFGLDTDPKFVTAKDFLVEAGAVILATGKPVPKERLIRGEEKFVGQGVSYCATCDGPLFRGAGVVAVGHSEEAREDVLALQEMGCRVLWVPERAREALPENEVSRIESRGVAVRWGVRALEIAGDRSVEKVLLGRDGQVEEVPASGVFIFREIPPGPLLGRAGLTLDHKQCVAVDRFQRTNIPGVLAAGDVTCGGLQVVAAAGEGCVAALQAVLYLRK